MLKTIVIVNGAQDWRPLFPGMSVVQVQLSRSRWLLERGELRIVDPHGSHHPDALIWRLGAVSPSPMHRACLEMIRLSGVPCINSAGTLLRGYDRLSMLHELRVAGLPVIEFDCVAASSGGWLRTQRALPVVLKVGNLHGGDGKALLRHELDCENAEALSSIWLTQSGYATFEPHVKYVRDVRCLAIGGQMWAMERRGEGWRANVNTSAHELIAVPGPLADWTQRAMQHLDADILGLDFLEREDGSWVVLESNDIPGLAGFPDVAMQALASVVREKL